MNRVLILGSSRVTCTELAKHVVEQMTSPVDWTVVTSYENNKLRWQALSRIKTCFLAKEITGDQPPGLEDQVILDSVVSTGVLAKPWVQKLVREGHSFICATPNPLQFLTLRQVFEFDAVLIAPKTSKLKLLQFAAALIPDDTVKQTELMNQAGGMTPNHFMAVQRDGSFSIMNMLGSTPTEEEKKAPDHPAMKQKREPTYYRPLAATQKDFDQAVATAKAAVPEMKEPAHLKTFKIEKELPKATPQEHVKVWVNMETRAKEPEVVETCLNTLKDALQERLIMSLFQESFIEKFETKDTHKILLCFYVNEANLDLFSVLLLRILRALRNGRHIRRGGLFF